MDKRAASGRADHIQSILKKPKTRRKGDIFDKSTKIRREKVERSSKKGEDVRAPLPQGCTPLMYACQQADYAAVVDELNKDPSSIRARDRGLRSALHYCASSGGASPAARATCADRLLMAAPALAGARDADGLTPLHLAVVHGNVPLVQTLLAAGADVNARDDEDHTVVHWATVCGEVGALRAVLAAGADPATPDQHGGYPLHYAAQMCGAPAATDHQARGAALEVLRALVREGGASVDVRDADGRTPLLWAASAGSAAAVLALHQAGARVDDADRDGLTALHCAAARGHTEALETLVGLCGARVDVSDSHGCTPLHYAAALGHADSTASLLQHGADSHRQDRRGRSPAHTAAAKGQIETVRMLGARGANLWLRNSKGDLPLHEAVASGRRELVKWLLDGRPSQVNATNHDGRTPLHIAAATDNADLCRLLLDRGAEVNPVTRNSKNETLTPLDCATTRGHRSTAKYLQMHGGLPASKLTNTQIVIDGAPITSLPTRRVTSTKIDVRDRIRIEKREVVEVSSPVPERRHFKSKHQRSSSEESSSDNKKSSKRYQSKYSKQHARRKNTIVHQKSFSDGYDTEIEGRDLQNTNEIKHRKDSKKNRSRSEPTKRSSSKGRYHHRYRSGSENSSETQTYSERKKSKKHRKRSKRRSSYSSESSNSESSDRRNTKRKGKKTSIHIENDYEKQRVNIVKYKSGDSQAIGNNEKDKETETEKLNNVTNEDSKNMHQLSKNRTLSETETDTLSVKTNMIVTEAQIHVARESDQKGGSEITVTVDSSNNVSIETSNMTVTHKDLKQEDMPESEKLEITLDSQETTLNDQTVILNNQDKKDNSTVENAFQNTEVSQLENSVTNVDHSMADSKEIDKTDSISKPPEVTEIPSVSPEGEQVRKRSFEVLAGPDEIKAAEKSVSDAQESQERSLAAAVSFANKDEIFQSKDSEQSLDNVIGEGTHDTVKSSMEDRSQSSKAKINSSESNMLSSEDIRQEYASTTASSSELVQSVEKGLVGVLDGNAVISDRAVQQVIMEDVSEDVTLPLSQSSPKRVRKSSKDSSSRKSSIYETESYKVLSDIASAAENSTGILKKSPKVSRQASFIEDKIKGNRLTRDSSLGRVPSVSDNEIYSHSEVIGRKKRLRKKSRTKTRSAIRSKSENSERGYESSGLMDSGFEPSPRVVQRRIMSPRLAAYYQQRNASGRFTGKIDSKIPVRKPGDRQAVDMKSVTQRIQTNMRRYYCERKIFAHLLELKRLQIRTSKTNEAVLVKRAIDEYNKSSLASVGMGPYNIPDFTFSSFEKFLYESLRKLQKSGKRHLDNLPEMPVDFDYGENELYKMSAIPDNPCLCTNKTHRCFHAIHAYTGVPCSAYLPSKWNHHTMPKPSTAGGLVKSRSFLPKINSKPPPAGSKAHVTLEVAHGTERQLIALPAERLDKNKRYYVTFTVKGSEPPSDDNASPKSVKSG